MIFTISFPVTFAFDIKYALTAESWSRHHRICDFPFRVNRRHGTDRQTDGRTDRRGATLNAVC